MGFLAYFNSLQFLLITAFLATVVSSTTSTVCSPTNRTADLQKCLVSITSLAKSDSFFWFGTDYKVRCPQGPRGFMDDCSNELPNQTNIITRVFKNQNSFDESLVDRFLDVKFTTTAGSYEVCGNTYTVTGSKTIDIDPTSPGVLYPYEVKMAPSVTWTVNSTEELYTLFIMDVGYPINHGIYINIPGNDLNSGEAFKPYHGPLQFFTSFANVYAMFLFNQDSRITLPDDWYAKLNTSMMNYTVPQMSTALNLTGPVAINWMRIVGDAYAVKQWIQRRTMYLCPYLVQNKIRQHNRTFIPTDVSLTVNLDVTFTPPALKFTSCCTAYNYPAKTLMLNPLGDAKVKCGEVRADGTPTVALSKYGGYFNSKNFTGTMYTLLAVDPDVPYDTAGTQEKPLLHWQVINIQNGDLSTGEVLKTYAGPAPPDNKPHYYYFLLYNQEMELNASTFTNYTTPGTSRFLFDIAAFVADQKLTLVGASWMIADTDEYTRYDYTELRGRDKDTFCTGVQGYGTPCPVSTATTNFISTVCLFWTILASVISIFM